MLLHGRVFLWCWKIAQVSSHIPDCSLPLLLFCAGYLHMATLACITRLDSKFQDSRVVSFQSIALADELVIGI